MFRADSYSPDDMVMHPRHQAMQPVLVQLIQQLRDCETVEAGVDFQRALLTCLLEVEKDRWEFKRAVTRMRNGKQPHLQAPELQSGRDPADIATWRFEHDVCERLARQLRSVGDALAWRVFDFHRPFILALCRNQSPGPMYGKAGLAAELEHLERACKEDDAFALLHDLTNCLRIGDMTVWDGVHPPRTEEIKTNPKNSKSAQLRRINQARGAVLDGGPLPGTNASELLYDLNLPLRTHLDVLRDALERAATEGIYATAVPGSRALFVVDQYGCSQQGLSAAQFNERLQRTVGTALQRAGIAAGREDYNINATSLDSTARDPLRVPWANYPLHPVACARLIGDYAVATVETSGPVLTRLLQAAGLDARWVRPPGNADLQQGEVIMEIHQQEQLRSVALPGGLTMTRGWTLQMRRSELDRYLIELLQPGSWVAGIKGVLAARQAGRPWPHYRNEHEIWV
ncbi:hypothetical protein AS594_38755 [Streptomyces agglomeratus]|uniref:Uncharacterized protein n=1 Tax=Streptomyces agglomeratus TaxID=285458 RepID=A0A1E5NYU7_9ACTN|nr:hypothetical protein [Streptomyces agglomeratus]OEJ21492.1 hypothetical protein AS594_38755 [Streptomyces agglomeratus]